MCIINSYHCLVVFGWHDRIRCSIALWTSFEFGPKVWNCWFLYIFRIVLLFYTRCRCLQAFNIVVTWPCTCELYYLVYPDPRYQNSHNASLPTRDRLGYVTVPTHLTVFYLLASLLRYFRTSLQFALYALINCFWKSPVGNHKNTKAFLETIIHECVT